MTRNDSGVRVQDFDAAIFDLDGVVTRTARVHAAAWKCLFDEYLHQRTAKTGEPVRSFDVERDYPGYVDGKPRYDGVAAFLESRGIALPRGDPSDPSGRETMCGLGNRKDRYFHEILQQYGVEVFDSTVGLIRRLRDRHIRTALVSSSRNARTVIEAAGLTELFDVVIDGHDITRLGLSGKPEPDLFLKAAKNLGVQPARTIIIEDALSGVQAGRAGAFGLVVGVNRGDQANALKSNGADIVISDLADLNVRVPQDVIRRAAQFVPSAFERYAEIERELSGKHTAVFLDYDGTLTPIVERPDQAELSQEMRRAVKTLAAICTVAIISGRDRADVHRLVGLDDLVYAGSHGFDIAGPQGLRIQHEEGTAFATTIRRAAQRLSTTLASIKGALVEPKRFAVAVHYRQVAAKDVPTVEAAVDNVLKDMPGLRKTFGKKVFEVRPRLDWDKGKAVLWLLRALGLDGPEVLPFYLGDDTTDEDVFAVLQGRGVGILVGRPARETAARYVLDTPADVGRFLGNLATTLEGRRRA